jgi:O-antigen/teichoic acid export membrane protein
LLKQGMKSVWILTFPICFLIFVFAPELLDIWLGANFSAASTNVLRMLVLGVFINSLAHPLTVLVQGIGKPERVAALHLFELPIYLAVLWEGVKALGIDGAALAWLLRVSVDAAALLWVALSLLNQRLVLNSKLIVNAAVGTLLFVPPVFLGDTLVRAAFAVAVLVLFYAVAWLTLFNEGERKSIRSILRRVWA